MSDYPDYSTLERRTCESCGRPKLLKFFHGDTVICKQCDKASRVAVRRHMRKVTQKVDAQLLSHMEAFIEKHKSRPPMGELPHVGAAAELFLEAYGGLDGLALLHVSEFLTAKPGGSVRQRHLSEVRKLHEKAEAAGYTKKPLSMYTLEELQNQIEELSPQVFRLTHDDSEETKARAAS